MHRRRKLRGGGEGEGIEESNNLKPTAARLHLWVPLFCWLGLANLAASSRIAGFSFSPFSPLLQHSDCFALFMHSLSLSPCLYLPLSLCLYLPLSICLAAFAAEFFRFLDYFLKCCCYCRLSWKLLKRDSRHITLHDFSMWHLGANPLTDTLQ